MWIKILIDNKSVMYWYACKAWAVDVPCIYFIYVQQSFLFQEDVTFDHPAPSAPLVRQESILARGLNSECVICLDRQVQYGTSYVVLKANKYVCTLETFTNEALR